MFVFRGVRVLSKVFPRKWNLKDYLVEQKRRVEERLKTLPREQGRNTRAREAMRYALDLPGKRFRPLLTLATADIYRKSQEPLVLDGAVAIECIHTASLLLDDLPCMDDASLRRGCKPPHLIYGEDQTILAGMCLVAEANGLLADDGRGRRSQLQKRLECLSLLNRSFAVEGLSGGQSDDLLNRTDLSIPDLEYIHAKKTGALFTACTEMAAVLCDATASERQWLVAYAKNLGLAFQIQDDLLDLKSSQTTGKDSGKDDDKVTFVKLVGEARCIELYEELIDVALKNLEPFGQAAHHIHELTRVIRARKF